MRRLLPLLSLVLVAALAGTARADDIRSTTVHGRVASWSLQEGVTVRVDGGGSLTCDFHRGESDVQKLLLMHIKPGEAVTLICFSGDGGATWDYSRLVPDAGRKVSAVGVVTRITPSTIEVTPDDGVWLTCNYGRADAAKIVPLEVGLRVKLTCGPGGPEIVRTKAKPVTTLTVTGTYIDMTPSEGLIVSRQGAVPQAFFFSVSDSELAAIQTLDLNEGDQITVTAAAHGTSWVVANVARAS